MRSYHWVFVPGFLFLVKIQVDFSSWSCFLVTCENALFEMKEILITILAWIQSSLLLSVKRYFFQALNQKSGEICSALTGSGEQRCSKGVLGPTGALNETTCAG